jgi:hypothetical protein
VFPFAILTQMMSAGVVMGRGGPDFEIVT